MTRFGERIDGTIYDLAKNATVRQARIREGASAYVWLGDEIAGSIGRERRHHRGRECWRWVGRDVDGRELPDTVSPERAVTMRAVAKDFLRRRGEAQTKR